MNLNQLETFVHVAEHGSFSKAALVLGVAQPALSRQVRALEVELREPLFLRHGRGVQLTETGRRLLDHCHGILHLVAQAKEDLAALRDEPVGHVAIAMPPTLARHHTLPLIRAFRKEMPKARLAIIEGFSAHITEWLASGRADLGLVYNPEPLPSLEIRPLRDERLCLVSPAHEAPAGPVTLRQLSKYPLVIAGAQPQLPQADGVHRSDGRCAAAHRVGGVQRAGDPRSGECGHRACSARRGRDPPVPASQAPGGDTRCAARDQDHFVPRHAGAATGVYCRLRRRAPIESSSRRKARTEAAHFAQNGLRAWRQLGTGPRCDDLALPAFIGSDSATRLPVLSS
jgi:DNA-binding transcriptional LysR family regulator